MEIPQEFKKLTEEKRQELIEKLADINDLIAEKLVEDKEITVDEIKQAIRKATIERTFIPVMMGSALKNTGIQLLLDGIVDYLPNPTEVYPKKKKKHVSNTIDINQVII